MFTDVGTGNPVFQFDKAGSAVRMAFSPGGKRLAVVVSSGDVKVWPVPAYRIEMPPAVGPSPPGWVGGVWNRSNA